MLVKRKIRSFLLLILSLGCKENVRDVVRPLEEREFPVTYIEKNGVRERSYLLKEGVYTFDLERDRNRVHLRFALDGNSEYAVVQLEVSSWGGYKEVVVNEKLDSGSSWVTRVVNIEVADNAKLTLRVVGGTVAFSTLRIGSSEAGKGLVFILVDTLRQDIGYSVLSLERYLSTNYWRFDNAFAPSPWTLPSVASIFVGQDPTFIGGVVHPSSFKIDDQFFTLAEYFRENNYKTAAFVANAIVTPMVGFDQGFDTFYYPPSTENDNSWLLLGADDLLYKVSQWIEANRGEKYFLYIHLLDPHAPYLNSLVENDIYPYKKDIYKGDLNPFSAHGLLLGRQSVSGQEDVDYLRSLYSSEVFFLDRYLDFFLGRFEKEFESKVVVLTSDHGEEFYDHGGFSHGRSLFNEQLKVPLVVWKKGIGKKIVKDPVTVKDIGYFLLKMLDEKGYKHWEPRSLQKIAGSKNRIYFSALNGAPRRVALLSYPFKLILNNLNGEFSFINEYDKTVFNLERPRLDVFYLFNILKDPYEKTNLAALFPTKVEGGVKMLYKRIFAEEGGLFVLLNEGDLKIKISPRGDRKLRFTPLFLVDNDRVIEDNFVIEISLSSGMGNFPRGVRIWSEWDNFVLLEAPPKSKKFFGSTPIEVGQVIGYDELYPLYLSEADVFIWNGRYKTRSDSVSDSDQLRRLKALGYID